MSFKQRLNAALAKIIGEDIEQAIITKFKQLITPPKSRQHKWQISFNIIDRDDLGADPVSTDNLPMMVTSNRQTMTNNDDHEAAISITAVPIGPDPHGLVEMEGPIRANVIIRTEAKGIMAYVQTEHYADEECLIGKRGVLAKSTFEQVAIAINNRFQEWADGLDEAHADPHHVNTLLNHLDHVDQFKNFLHDSD